MVEDLKMAQNLLYLQPVILPLGGRKFQGPEIAHNQHPLKKAVEKQQEKSGSKTQAWIWIIW